MIYMIYYIYYGLDAWLMTTFISSMLWNYYKDLFTHKDINTYINGVV